MEIMSLLYYSCNFLYPY